MTFATSGVITGPHPESWWKMPTSIASRCHAALNKLEKTLWLLKARRREGRDLSELDRARRGAEGSFWLAATKLVTVIDTTGAASLAELVARQNALAGYSLTAERIITVRAILLQIGTRLQGSPAKTAPAVLSETALRIKTIIDTEHVKGNHLIAKEIGRRIGTSEENVRRVFQKHLKPLGYHNALGSKGYFPPRGRITFPPQAA